MPRTLELDDLFRIPFCSDPDLRPDGSAVAFVVTRADREADRNRSSIWTVPVDGGAAVPFTHGSSDICPRWSPDGSTLAFVSARGQDGDEAQIFLIPSDGGEARRLTDAPKGAGDPAWSPDGGRLAFLGIVDLHEDRDDHAPRVIRRLNYKADGVGYVGSRRRHLFVVDVSSGDVVQLTSGDFSVGDLAWSPDGRRIAYTAATAEDRDVEPLTSVFVVDAAGGEAREVTRGRFAAPAWSPDGETLVVAGRPELVSGHARLYLVSAGGGEPQELAPGFDRNVMVGGPAYPGARPRFTDDGERVIFCARDRGCVHVYATPATGGGESVKIVGGEDRVVGGLSTAGGRMAFVAALPASTGEIFVASADGSDERRITDLVADALPDVSLYELEARSFEGADGAEVHAWLIRGPSDGPAPTLLDVHGGPHNSWFPAFDGVHLWHQLLAAQGWTIVCPNPRGSDGYGEHWYTAVCGGWGLLDERDFHDVLDALVADGTSDPDRLAVTGYSYGGFMTCWLTARTDRFAAGVAGGTVVNLTSEAGTAEGGPLMSRVELGGYPWEISERFRDMSPISYVDGVEAPTLILHGEEDHTCPVGQAEEWFAALRVRGVPVEFVRYPGGGHLFILTGRPSHRIDYTQRVVDWVTAHVPAAAPRVAVADRSPD